MAQRLGGIVGVEGHLVQILDPSEETLPFDGRVEFEGPEGEGTIMIGRVESVRQAYAEELAHHQAGLDAGPDLYATFRDKADGCVKVMLRP